MFELHHHGGQTISIHALREEGDFPAARVRSDAGISIHALREEGDFSKAANTASDGISIHALREEGDMEKICVLLSLNAFLSTPSARRATAAVVYDALELAISIHALREEGDR